MRRPVPGSWSISTSRSSAASPTAGGWRAHGRGSAPALAADRAKTRTRRQGSPVGGYRYIHHAIDDYSRVVYSEILDDERKQTAAGFFQRANAFFKDLGVTVQAVIGLLGVFRTLLVLCFRLPSLSSGARVRPRSGCDIPGLSEGGHDCISARSMRQYP